MTMKTTICTRNPYRLGSKLHHIFNFMADGNVHTLVAITNAAYFPGAGNEPLYRRRVSSALRTIRNLPCMDVDFGGKDEGYCLYTF